MKQWILAAALAVGMGTGVAVAQDGEDVTFDQFLATLHYKQGTVALPGADATLAVGDGFRFLAAADAQRVLEQAWGNPPDDTVLGLIVPDADGLDSEHSWAVVVTYSDDGFVSDEDAREIDYAEILADMQEETESANDDRKSEGYPVMHLKGWAQPPSYDAAGKRLHWAKELQVEGADSNALNYDIRVLGREGYLSLNAVADIADLARVKDGMEKVLPMAQFNPGHAYADHKDGDKTAAYGLAALVAGGVAAKTGLFAKLGLLLLSLKKGIVLVFLAIAAGFKKITGLFKKKPAGTVS